MDLIKPVTPEKSWHPYFANMIDRPNSWNEAVVNDWSTGFVDRDGKFIKEFQTTFNSCFWELYLNAVLRNRGLSVDFGNSSPDFVVTAPCSFTIEATIASHAQGQLPEYAPLDWTHIPDDLNELNRQAILRLTNSIRAKYEKFRTDYAALPHVAGKPFVLAIAPFDRPHFNLACQRAIEATLFNYYVDEESYMSEGDFDSPIPRLTLESARKDNGTDVELGLFASDSIPEVSAIMFTTCATWGKVRALSKDPNPEIFFTALRLNPHSSKPHIIKASKSEYSETLLDGLRVYHNPYATYPLDPAVFRSNEVFQTYKQSGDWVYEQAEGQLLSRMVVTLLEHQQTR